MRSRSILWLAVIHVCLLMMYMGGAVFETFVNFPNWFRDVPSSLEAARDYFVVRNPGHFFQTIFPLTILSLIALLAVAWRFKKQRNLLLAALALMAAVEAGTIALMYPKIDVLLREGTASHSVEELRETGQSFVQFNYVRMALVFVLSFGLAVPAATSLIRLSGAPRPGSDD